MKKRACPHFYNGSIRQPVNATQDEDIKMLISGANRITTITESFGDVEQLLYGDALRPIAVANAATVFLRARFDSPVTRDAL